MSHRPATDQLDYEPQGVGQGRVAGADRSRGR